MGELQLTIRVYLCSYFESREIEFHKFVQTGNSPILINSWLSKKKIVKDPTLPPSLYRSTICEAVADPCSADRFIDCA